MLIYCPDCLEEISHKAISCPKCGNPIDDDAHDYHLQKQLRSKVIKKSILRFVLWFVIPIAISLIVVHIL